MGVQAMAGGLEDIVTRIHWVTMETQVSKEGSERTVVEF